MRASDLKTTRKMRNNKDNNLALLCPSLGIVHLKICVQYLSVKWINISNFQVLCTY